MFSRTPRIARPPVSHAAPRAWCRPLAPGVLPAYDRALELLEADSAQLKSEARVLRDNIRAIEQQRSTTALEHLDVRLEALRTKLRILNVQAEANLPSVRWRVANAMRKSRLLVRPSG